MIHILHGKSHVNIFLRNINFHYQDSHYSGPEHELYVKQLEITLEKSHIINKIINNNVTLIAGWPNEL